MFGDVESANIVGYQEAEVKYSTGVNFLIPTFVDMTSKTAAYDLQSIRMVDAPGDGMSDTITILNEFGALTDDDDIAWCTYEGEACEEGYDGWYPVGGGAPEDRIEGKTYPLGTGLYMNIGTEGAHPLYAGQVFVGAQTNDVPQVGVNFIGNSSPVEIDLQDMVLVDAPGDGMSDTITILNEFGALTDDDDIAWCTYEGEACDEGYDGWYPVGGGSPDDRIVGFKLAPGQGVYFNAGTPDIKFVVPSPIK